MQWEKRKKVINKSYCGILKGMKEGKKKICINALFGALIGLICALFGGGGGVLCIPVLQKANKLSAPEAHATALSLIFPLSLTCAVCYGLFSSPDLTFTPYTAVGCVIGTVAGSLFLNRISGFYLSLLFSLLLAGSGVFMLFSALR